jgi:hypothetical protein
VALLGRRGAPPQGSLIFRGRDRDDLVAGRLAVRVYTAQQPLGGPSLPIVVPALPPAPPSGGAAR